VFTWFNVFFILEQPINVTLAARLRGAGHGAQRESFQRGDSSPGSGPGRSGPGRDMSRRRDGFFSPKNGRGIPGFNGIIIGF